MNEVKSIKDILLLYPHRDNNMMPVIVAQKDSPGLYVLIL